MSSLNPRCRLLDQTALAQSVDLRPHAVKAAIAVDHEEPLCGQKSEDRVAETIVVSGGLAWVEAVLGSQRFQNDLANADRWLGGDEVGV